MDNRRLGTNLRLTVALLQLPGHDGGLRDAVRLGGDACRKAAAAGADIALFPEMWSCSYGGSGSRDAETLAGLSAARDSEFVRHFQDLAAELQMAIAITYLERWTPAPRNTVSLIDRNGAVALTYAKVHTCDFGWEAALTPGDSFPVASLSTGAGPVNVGAMICFDREFPESARVLMLEGAEIVLVPNACTMDPLRLMQLQTRAFENMMGVALANYAAPRNNGRSAAYDGVATECDDGPLCDMQLALAGACSEIVLATFDLARMRAYRRREAWGDAYRRPRVYGRLSDEAQREIFVRPDSRRRA